MTHERPTCDYSRETSVLKALASEARLKMVHHLSSREACVCDLVEIVGLDQSTVSKHLAVLKAADIVDRERRGRHIFYRLIAPCVLSFLTCAAAVAADQTAEATSDEATSDADREACDDTPLAFDGPADSKESAA